MKQNISILMDGELYSDEADVLLEKIIRQPEAQQVWLTYHMIGDALRNSDYLHLQMKQNFKERLHAEPIVIAPYARSSKKFKPLSYAAAASIIAMLTWLSLQIDTRIELNQVQQRTSLSHSMSTPGNGNFVVEANMSNYLLAHQEFSPGSDIRGASSYLRTVSYQSAMVGK